MNKLKIMLLAVLSGLGTQTFAVASGHSEEASNPAKFCMGLLNNIGFSYLKNKFSEDESNFRAAMGLALRENYRALVDKAVYQTNSKLADFDNLKYRNSVYNIILTEIQRAMLNLDIYEHGSVKYNQCSYDNNGNEAWLLQLESTDGFFDSKDKYERSHLNYVLLINLIDRALNSTKAVDFGIIQEVSLLLEGKGWNHDLLNQSCSDINQYCVELGLYDYLKNLREAHNITKNLKTYSHEEVVNFIEKLPGVSGLYSGAYPVYPRKVCEEDARAYYLNYYTWMQNYSHRPNDIKLLYRIEIKKPDGMISDMELTLERISKTETDKRIQHLEDVKKKIVDSGLLSAIVQNQHTSLRKLDKAVTRIIDEQTLKNTRNMLDYKETVAEALDNLYKVSAVISSYYKSKVITSGYRQKLKCWITDLDRPFVFPAPLNVISDKIANLQNMIGVNGDIVTCIKNEYESLFDEKFEDIEDGNSTTKYLELVNG